MNRHCRNQYDLLRRRGTASLEFIFCLVALLPVFAFLMWTADAMIAKSNLAVVARHKAWQKRFDRSNSEPLEFNAMDGAVLLPAETQEVDRISQFRSLARVEARHVVLGNAWDYQQVPLNKQPNWSWYGRLAKEGVSEKGEDLSAQIAKISDLGGKLSGSILNNPDSAELQGIINGFAGELGIGHDAPQITIPPNEGKQKQAIEAYNAELKAQREDLQVQIAKRQETLVRLKARLKEIGAPTDNRGRTEKMLLEQRILQEEQQIVALNKQIQDLGTIDSSQLESVYPK